MLNRVIIMGRLTQEPELKQLPSGVSCLSFSVAVDRNYVKQGEERQTDFISCTAFRQTAEFIAKYFGKGRMIALEGQLRTRTYDDSNGVKRYVTEVAVDSVSFTGEKRDSSSPSEGAQQTRQTQQLSSGDPAGVYRDGNRLSISKPVQTGEPLDLSGLEDLGVLSDDGVPF